jgi:hypothetical protein
LEHLRDDLNCLSSVGLLVMVTITALTGVIADLWDLNDFWYHTYSGYVMAAFALAHVCLNWGRLTGYARFRFGRQETRGQALAASTPSPPAARHQRVLRTARRAVVSRRGFLALIVGGAGGFFLGQALRPPPIPKAIPKGSDL